MPNTSENKDFETMVKVNIKPTKSELKSVVIPNEIKKEFIKSNLKSMLLISLSTILLMFFILIICNHFLDNKVLNKLLFYFSKNLNKEIIQYFLSQTILVISITLIFILTLVWILNLINLKNLKIDLKRYKISILNNDSWIPFSITKIYKKIIKKPIIINWLLIFIYLLTGLFVCVIYSLKDIYNHFNAQFNWDVKNITIYLGITIGILFLIHIVLLRFLKLSKDRIDAYYGYEIISLENQIILKKQTNKRCLIIFLLLLVPLIIIWILIRKGYLKFL